MSPRCLRVSLRYSIVIALGAGCASAPPAKIAAAASSEAAPSLQQGKWTGWVKPEKEAALLVSYDIVVDKSAISIHLKSSRGEFAFYDVKLRGDSLTFVWPLLQCALTRRDDGRFEGDCALPDGSDRAQMAMFPPGK